jgi:hypothetical protein
VHELCCVQNSVRAYHRQHLKAFTPARAAGEKKAKGGGWGAMKAVLLAVQCVRLPARATQPSAVVLSQCALKRCNDVGGRLRDAGELFNKKGAVGCRAP